MWLVPDMTIFPKFLKGSDGSTMRYRSAFIYFYINCGVCIYMALRPSSIQRQIIVQWYAEGQQRSQRNFGTGEGLSRSLSDDNLAISTQDHFHIGTRAFAGGGSSFQIVSDLPPSDATSTDIFLYGHSTVREFTTTGLNHRTAGDEVRGVSIAHSYVSAGKMAEYMTLNFSRSMSKDVPVRIWLMSCHMADDIDGRSYALHFTQKLKERGWLNALIIAFRGEVNCNHTLPEVRSVAASTDLYTALVFTPRVEALYPHFWMLHSYSSKAIDEVARRW
jgi:hypothetical protein